MGRLGILQDCIDDDLAKRTLSILWQTKYFSKPEKDVGAGLIALDTSGACPE